VSEERWVWRAHGLLVDTGGRVFVLASDGMATLPYTEVEVDADLELPSVRAAFAGLVGAETVVVRSVAREVHEERRVVEAGLQLEPVGSPPAPSPGVDWVGPDDLARYSLSPRDRELLELVFSDRPPPERPPWARPGWFSEASAWIEDVLAENGRQATGPVEQVSSWCISSILRAPTAEGMVFFKATARSPLFVDEGSVTRELSRLFPENVPRVIATDSERRWMLLDDFGPVVGWKASLERRVEVLALHARLQIAAAGRVDELIAHGALDRRPAWLAAEIEALLRVPDALGLEDAELEQLAGLGPTLAAGCARLTAGAVPDTLVHGDLHMGNVARKDGRYVFFDWTDACVTHPFLDLIVVLFEEDPDLRHALRDAYLSVWAELAAEEELLELWSLAEPLAALNQAVSYRYLIGSVEPGTAQEFEQMLPYFLRKALAANLDA
jgi:fructosamine-3-kinase